MYVVLTKQEKEEKARKDSIEREEARKRQGADHIQQLKRDHAPSPISGQAFGMIIIGILFFLFAILPALMSEPLTLEQAINGYDEHPYDPYGTGGPYR